MTPDPASPTIGSCEQPMEAAMFESARLKLERAKQHIADLQVRCDAFTSDRHHFGFFKDA